MIHNLVVTQQWSVKDKQVSRRYVCIWRASFANVYFIDDRSMRFSVAQNIDEFPSRRFNLSSMRFDGFNVQTVTIGELRLYWSKFRTEENCEGLICISDRLDSGGFSGHSVAVADVNRRYRIRLKREE